MDLWEENQARPSSRLRVPSGDPWAPLASGDPPGTPSGPAKDVPAPGAPCWGTERISPCRRPAPVLPPGALRALGTTGRFRSGCPNGSSGSARLPPAKLTSPAAPRGSRPEVTPQRHALRIDYAVTRICDREAHRSRQCICRPLRCLCVRHRPAYRREPPLRVGLPMPSPVGSVDRMQNSVNSRRASGAPACAGAQS